MEDYSEEDLEKVKSKSAETGNAIRQVEDDELKQEPAKAKKAKKESKSTFTKQKPLWLCNSCFKTFRSDENICSCKSTNTEKITEGEGWAVGHLKHVYNVEFELAGKKDSTRVEAFDEPDAKRLVQRIKPGAKILGITKVQEDKIPGGLADKSKPEDFDKEQVEAGTKVEMEHTKDPKVAQEIAMDHLTEDPDYYRKLKKMEAGKDNPCPKESKKEESKVTETVEELIGEVPGISKEDQLYLKWALNKNLISNTWPDEDVISDALAEITDQVPGEEMYDPASDNQSLYLKYVLVPKAKFEAMKMGVTVPKEVTEQKEDWDLTFKYTHNQLTGNPLLDKEGNPYLNPKLQIEGKRIRVFTDYQAGWVEGKGAVPVRESKVQEQEELEAKSIGEIVDDLAALVMNLAQVKSDAKVLLSQCTSDRELTVKLLAKLKVALGLVESAESRVEEQEKDTYATIAKGIVDKAEADRLARDKKGMVVADEEDPKKFMVIVKEAIEEEYKSTVMRSKMIGVMYDLGYSLVGERKEEAARVLEFRKGEDVIEIKLALEEEKD
jgi:hypothetical protein